MAERLPQPLLVGIYGIEVGEEVLRVLRESNAAGIYLLRRNVESPEQVRSLVSGLEQELGYRLLVAIDHEGGRVYRFTRGITFFPGNLALGKAGTPAFAYEVGRAMGRELSAMGVNINFAPVLDLESEEMNSALMLRAFGPDPTKTSTMGTEMMRGLREEGIASTARSFPGKGSAVSRGNGSVSVDLSRETLLEREIAPFRAAIAAGTPLVMTSSAVYPALDPDRPAMFSSAIVTELLRRDLDFKGVIITEDLTSPATLRSVSIEDAIGRGIQAGNDLCLVAHDYDNVKRATRGLKAAVEGGRVSPGLLEKGQKRVQALLQRKHPMRPALPDDAEESQVAATLAGIIAGSAVRVERDPQGILPIDFRKRAGVLVPRMWDLADRIEIDVELRGAAGLIQSWVQAHSSTIEVLEVPVQADRDMMRLTLDWAGGLEIVAQFCFDAHRYAGQRKLLEEVQRRCPKVAAVLLANPWDRAFVAAQNTVINTFGFRVCQLSAAISVLFGKPAGRQ